MATTKKTAGEATQAPATQAQADPKPTVPGAAPATAATAAEDEAADDEDDSEDEHEHDDPETDDEEKADLRQLVRELRAEKADLQEQLTAERQRSGEAAGELNEAQTLIEELQKRLERSENREAQSGAVIVSHGEVDYKVLAPKFQFEGKVYQAADLKDDAALVARLVAAEVGFLHPLTAGE